MNTMQEEINANRTVEVLESIATALERLADAAERITTNGAPFGDALRISGVVTSTTRREGEY